MTRSVDGDHNFSLYTTYALASKLSPSPPELGNGQVICSKYWQQGEASCQENHFHPQEHSCALWYATLLSNTSCWKLRSEGKLHILQSRHSSNDVFRGPGVAARRSSFTATMGQGETELVGAGSIGVPREGGRWSPSCELANSTGSMTSLPILIWV